MRVSLITGVLLYLGVSLGLSQTRDEFGRQCATDDPAENIKVCSALIASGQLSNKACPVHT